MKDDMYLNILNYELITAMGCTEPIAVAFVAACARDELGGFPNKMCVKCSSNIIKNVQGVIIPNTGGKRGIRTAAIAGALCGHSENKLDVLQSMNESNIEMIDKLLRNGICTEERLESDTNLAIDIVAQREGDSVEVRLRDSHTNITYVEKNGVILYEADSSENSVKQDTVAPDYSGLTTQGIFQYAETCDMGELESLLSKQISFNMAIAEEGLKNSYGANVGKTILESFGGSMEVRAIAYAAAGSDARMGGCTYPVVINCGSGNQGLTIALPIEIYAEELNLSKDRKYRALIMANLLAVHIKSHIGRLSAFCGAVSAAGSVAAALIYMQDGNHYQAERAIEMTLATVGGMVCDGAKSSCASKIAVSLCSAIISSKLALAGKRLHSGEGLVKDGVEATIDCIGLMAGRGMKETDKEILRLMLNDEE